MSQTIDKIIYSDDLKTVEGVENKEITTAVIKEGVTTIGDSAFSHCTNLQNVAIPECVTTIGHCAFDGCTNLQNIVIPESVTTIVEEAFQDCENLKEVHLGGNIEKLSGQIFDGCPNVELFAPEKSLTEKAIKKNAKLKKLYKKLEQAKQAKITEIKAAGTEGLLRAYSEGIGKEQKIGQIEKNIEVTILTNELDSENNSKYAKITVPEKTVQKKLSEIQTAFDEVRSEGINVTVEKLLETLKKNVESFEWEIYNEKDDRTIYLVKVLKPKGKNPWWNSLYSEFKNVIVSKKVKEIKEYAFYRCSNLQSVVIPSSVTTIGEQAFYKCTNLQNVVIPSSVTTIVEWAFDGCKNLQSVVIPSSVTTIGSYAFKYCKIENYEHKIFKVKNGCCLSSDGKKVLYCANVSKEEIVIPEGVTTIGGYAFVGCRNLQSVVIPSSVTRIEWSAFYNCPKLTVTFDGTKEEWKKIEGVEDCYAKNVKFNK